MPQTHHLRRPLGNALSHLKHRTLLPNAILMLATSRSSLTRTTSSTVSFAHGGHTNTGPTSGVLALRMSLLHAMPCCAARSSGFHEPRNGAGRAPGRRM